MHSPRPIPCSGNQGQQSGLQSPGPDKMQRLVRDRQDVKMAQQHLKLSQGPADPWTAGPQGQPGGRPVQTHLSWRCFVASALCSSSMTRLGGSGRWTVVRCGDPVGVESCPRRGGSALFTPGPCKSTAWPGRGRSQRDSHTHTGPRGRGRTPPPAQPDPGMSLSLRPRGLPLWDRAVGRQGQAVGCWGRRPSCLASA